MDGANYLFPGDYSIQGIIYNKTLFEKNGWKMPHNFKELKELTNHLVVDGDEADVGADDSHGNAMFIIPVEEQTS